jgi:hypothetical protein
VIYAVDWASDVVWLKNTAATDVLIGAAWDICTDGFNYQTLPAYTIPAGGDMFLHLRAPIVDDTDPNDAHFNLGIVSGFDLDEDHHLILFRTAGGHATSGIEAYLKWGASAPSFRDTQGVDSGLWTAGATVPVTPGDTAIVASGDVRTAAGFASIANYSVCTP